VRPWLIRRDRESDAGTIARFQNEVQATARLTHPNTVEIYDYGITDNGTFFYVMEFLPGLSVQELVERSGPLPAGRVIHLLRQVCSALAEAHRAGLIHRDIKPGNIFAAERGGIHDFAKLLDFGLVKSTGGSADNIQHTRDGVVVGSPLYAAPEAALGEGTVDERVDQYSLGATAYFMLTGRPVFPGTRALDIVVAHARDLPLPASVCRCAGRPGGDRPPLPVEVSG
jgi:serine/threonine-protein kinase